MSTCFPSGFPVFASQFIHGPFQGFHLFRQGTPRLSCSRCALFTFVLVSAFCPAQCLETKHPSRKGISSDAKIPTTTPQVSSHSLMPFSLSSSASFSYSQHLLAPPWREWT